MSEDELKNAVIDAIKEVFNNGDRYADILKENIRRVLGNDNSKAIRDIEEKLEKKQDEIIETAKKKESYDDLADEIEALRKEKADILTGEAMDIGASQRMDEMCDFIEEHHDDPVEYDDKLTRKLVDKVTVGDYSLEVTFKCGIRVGI